MRINAFSGVEHADKRGPDNQGSTVHYTHLEILGVTSPVPGSPKVEKYFDDAS